MSAGYWQGLMGRRRSRRSFVGGVGATAAVLALGACSSDGDPSSDGGDGGGGLLSRRENTTSKAVPGGTYASFFSSEPRTQQSVIPNIVGRVYSRLLQYKLGVLGVAPRELEGDLTESWEVSRDGMQYTFKLRPDAKWDPRPPTNGRTLTAEDVVYTWQRFEQVNPNRSDLANSVSSAAPILTMQAPDSRTVVVKLAFPSTIAIYYLATHARFFILPAEAGSQFNPDNEARGSGPFMIKDYTPSVGLEYVKNPNWYRKDRPFLDGWSTPILTEYAQRLAQFRAGNIWGGGVSQEDIITTKRDLPQLLMHLDDEYSYIGQYMHFGFAGNSPWKDDRVRRAASMLIERKTLGEVLNNVQEFEAEGLHRQDRWASHIPNGFDGAWLDPQGNELGEGAANFKYNPQESRRLLDAAGYAGRKVESIALYGGNLAERPIAAMIGMINEGGFNLKQTLAASLNAGAGYTPFIRSGGDFEGCGFYALGAVAGIPQVIFSAYHRQGAWNLSNTTLSPNGDSQLNSMIEASTREFDTEKQTGLIKDVQKYLAKTMAPVPVAVNYQPFSLTWPFVGNAGVFRHDQQTLYDSPDSEIHLWYDRSKA